MTILAIALTSAAGSMAWASKKDEIQSPCPQIQIVGDMGSGLSGAETRLVCGDPDPSDAVGRAWGDIPKNQAKFHLGTFLQDRGRYRPVFSDAEGKLRVDPGPPTIVTSLRAEGAPESLDLGRKRQVVGELLTPKLLGSVETWVTQRLTTLGYPCPKVSGKADATSGEIVLTVDPGPFQNLAEILEDEIPGVEPGILRRYDPFRFGYPYDSELLSLSATRTLSQGIVQSVYFNASCEERGAVVRQGTVAGPPRLLSFSVGANTEELVKLKTSWRNTRLGRSASEVEVSAQASSKRQRISTSFTWYPLPYPSRRYIKPLFEIEHRVREQFETLNARAELTPATSWDNMTWSLAWRAGPAYEAIRTMRGAGPGTSKFLSLMSEVTVMSHRFEFFQSTPRAGASLTFASDFTSKNIASDASTQRFRITGHALWNIRNFDPPLLVVGTRFGFASTIAGAASEVPVLYQHFLGGSKDLRGFGLDELPRNDSQGRLSMAFASLETRLVGALPLGFQPLLFIDAGKLGEKPVSLDSPWYWSPGGGLRWESPIGAIRGTLAHGYSAGYAGGDNPAVSHLQFFISLGEEF